MAEWVVAITAMVQALSTLVLVFITGYYAYHVKQQVKQGRDQFERKAAETAKLVDRQARDHQRRERAEIERAIRTIDAEFQVNLQDAKWRSRESVPLLDAAYRANLWAVCEIGITPETFHALGDAMLRIAAYNLRHVVAAEESTPANHNNCLMAWQEAQKALGAAMAALRSDPATVFLFGTRAEPRNVRAAEPGESPTRTA